MQVWSRGLKDVDTLTTAFPLPFLAAGFAGTWGSEDTVLKNKKGKIKLWVSFHLEDPEIQSDSYKFNDLLAA